jgi:hypothetical protein
VSSSAASAPTPLVAVGERLRRAKELVLSIRLAYVLGALLVAQWLALLALALTVRHNGWLYYAGGDQLWHYSGAYLLAHGHLPPTFVGYGWSIVLLPLAWLAGPNLVSALPGIVLANTLVLLPIALLCVYGIASRLAGRLFGYFAATVWIALPYLGILFVEPGYHQKYTELTLPQLLGLTSVPDFPATVALLVAAYLCLRAAETTGWHAAAAAGLACGYSLAIKPSNAIFLFAPAIFLLASRWSALPIFAAGLAPAVLTLALWKFRGLGQLAAAPAEPIRLAAGPLDLIHRIYSPKLGSWAHLGQVLDSLREHFWIARVLEWLPIAGCIGLLARSRRGFLLIGSWFIPFFLIKGTYFAASVEDASFFRLMMPAFPAYALLAAATVLLVPRTRAQPERHSPSLTGRRLTLAVGAAAAVFAAVPLGIIAATPPLHDGGTKAVREAASLVPVSTRLVPDATVVGKSVRLTWHQNSARGAAVFYRILRAGPHGGGMACAGTPRNASNDCRLFMDAVGATRVTTYADKPGPGTWTYRIGASANWLDDYAYGDVYVTSPPVTVTVP